MRIVQQAGRKGSLMLVQRLIARYPHLLDRELRAQGVLESDASVAWRSPLESDDWAEYRDRRFLRLVGKEYLWDKLKTFWPPRGPQWDALGLVGDTVLLVEAKAHVDEYNSSCAAKADASNRLINKAFADTKASLGADAGSDWRTGYYQLANRLAHLHFLTEHGVRAFLVLLHFTGETGMPSESSTKAYNDRWIMAMRHLGLGEATDLTGVVKVFMNVAEMESPRLG